MPRPEPPELHPLLSDRDLIKGRYNYSPFTAEETKPHEINGHDHLMTTLVSESLFPDPQAGTIPCISNPTQIQALASADTHLALDQDLVTGDLKGSSSMTALFLRSSGVGLARVERVQQSAVVWSCHIVKYVHTICKHVYNRLDSHSSFSRKTQ